MRPVHLREPSWVDPICHPLPLGAALLLAVNDHWLKGAGLLPALLTGKLSDVCGLFFFPVLLFVLAGAGFALTGRRPARRCASLVIGTVGAAFAAANLSPGFNAWLGGWWGHKVMDPTDLVALPALLASWLWLRRSPAVAVATRCAPGQLLGPAAVVACALASAATSPLRVSYPRNYPAWVLLEPARATRGASSLELWVSKSGKEGIGVTVEVQSCGESGEGKRNAEGRGQRLELLGAALAVGGQAFPAELPAAREVRAGETIHLYLPIPFDNERLWNQGQREGQLQVRLRLDGQELLLVARAAHRLDGFHRAVPRRAARDRPCGPPRCPYREVLRPPASAPATVLEPVPR
jgi:hypothetical protein